MSIIKENSVKEKLFFIIEKNDNNKSRIKALKKLGQFPLKNKEEFRFLENLLISDDNDFIRLISLKLLIRDFPEEVKKPLKWIIRRENSCIMLRFFLQIHNSPKFPELQFIKRLIRKRIEKLYKIIMEEAVFFLDLDIIKKYVNKEHNNKPLYKEIWLDTLPNIIYGTESPSYAISNNHVTALDLYGLKLNKLPKSISTLKKLEYLNLGFNNLKKLPISIGKLRCLRY